MNTGPHWQSVYTSKSDAQLSWTQERPVTSLALIARACRSGRVIDVGGGTSRLARCLLDAGYDVAVLDISAAALDRARANLGPTASRVRWIEADVTAVDDVGQFDVWHDRAVFHFLIEAADRARYAHLLARTVPRSGHAIVATFAPDGPQMCSRLPVAHYSGESLAKEIGPAFELVESIPDVHVSPGGKRQPFQCSLFRRV